MGCCTSIPTDTRTSDVGSEKSALTENRLHLELEETVKEVLSETSNFNRPSVFLNRNDKTQMKDPVLEKIRQEKPDFFSVHQNRGMGVKNGDDSRSEISEICSLSESVSRDDDDEHKQSFARMRSPAKSRSRVMSQSPTRRSDHSPNKRNGMGCGGGGVGSVRLVQGIQMGPEMGRTGVRSDPRRDPGEKSGRRSRSPAMNRSTVGRSPSGRKTSGSPGRVRLDPSESFNKRRMEQSSGVEGKWPSCGSGNGNYDNAPNESLENPLVSLECFIFL